MSIISLSELDKKRGSKYIYKVELILGKVVYDITDYYLGGAVFAQNKEKLIDKPSLGSVTFTLSNHDNKFTDTNSISILYNKEFLNKAKIKYYQGFKTLAAEVIYRWTYLGSGVDEGDSISPQTSTWDTATDIDKDYCYLGDGSGNDPVYHLL